MALCSIAGEYQCFRRMYCLHILLVGQFPKVANDMSGVSGIEFKEDKSCQSACNGEEGMWP